MAKLNVVRKPVIPVQADVLLRDIPLGELFIGGFGSGQRAPCLRVSGGAVYVGDNYATFFCLSDTVYGYTPVKSATLTIED